MATPTTSEDGSWKLEVSSSDRLTLSSSRSGKAAYQITNGRGEEIAAGERKRTSERFVIDMISWPSGVYTILIADEAHSETLHFVKT